MELWNLMFILWVICASPLSRVLLLELRFLQTSRTPKILLGDSQSFSLLSKEKTKARRKPFSLQTLLFFVSVCVYMSLL